MKAKSIFLVAVICLALLPTFVTAEDQEPVEPQNAISVDLLVPILSCVHVLSGGPAKIIPVAIEYQRVISDHFVLFAMGDCIYTIYDGWELVLSPLVEVGWHPFHRGLKGFHAGLEWNFLYDYAVAINGDAWTAPGTRYSYSTGLGLTLGWQFLLPAHIVMDLALGIISVNYNVHVDVNGVETMGFSLGDPMEIPRSTLALGFRF